MDDIQYNHSSYEGMSRHMQASYKNFLYNGVKRLSGIRSTFPLEWHVTIV
jgi:hypothetical protein